MKNIFNFLILVLVSLSSHAQVRFAPCVGVNISSNTLKSDAPGNTEVDTKSRIGFHSGLLAEYQVSRLLAYNIAMMYSQKGSKDVYDNFSQERRYHYMELAFNLMLTYPINNYARFIGRVGPYLAYCVGGKYKVKYLGTIEEDNLKIGGDRTDDVKPIDIGINPAIGIEIAKIQLMIIYGIGFSQINPRVDFDKLSVRNRNLMISFAYMFGKTK